MLQMKWSNQGNQKPIGLVGMQKKDPNPIAFNLNEAEDQITSSVGKAKYQNPFSSGNNRVDPFSKGILEAS